MKKLALLLILFVTFFNVKSQNLMNLRPTGYVNDYQGLFTPEQKNELERMMSDYEKKTSIEFSLVTSATFDPDSVVALGIKWGIGKETLDNGFMIFFSHSDIAGQSHYQDRPGYGLEEFLPDAKLNQLEDNILIPRLKNEEYFEGYKEFILACQNEIGYDGYNMLIKNKELKDAKDKAASDAFFIGLFQFILFLLLLSGVGYLIYLWYNKRKAFLELERKITQLLLNIIDLRAKFSNLPIDIQNIYDTRIETVTNKNTTEETLSKLNNIYNVLLDYRQTVNSIDNSLVSIENFKSNIQKYLNENYPYCDKYLKGELNKLLPDTKISDLKTGDYTKKRMNLLTGVQTSLDNKLNSFLSKTVKIRNIISDKNCINTTIQDLKKSYADYIKKKTILSTVKIGKRYESLVNLDFDSYLQKLNKNISDSFNYLEEGDYDQSVNSYGNYITTLSVVNSAFSSVNTLYDEYNKSMTYLKTHQSGIDKSISSIDGKINKSGVSYSRKSSFESIKTDITKYKKDEDYDVILAAASLGVIVNNINDVNRYVDSDISSYSSSSYSSSSSYDSGSSSYGSSDSYSSGGGDFGGGGSGGSF